VPELRWTEDAATDLERISDYLFEHAPERAADSVRRIYSAPGELMTFPNRGRPGQETENKGLVLFPLPYPVVYRVTADAVHILRILHGAQKWP
jgi:toxin ParE1/3/4